MSRDYPIIYAIKKIVNESQDVKSFYLTPFKKGKLKKPLPGNFIMLWVPLPKDKKVDYETPDSIPFSISDYYDDTIVLTIRKMVNTKKRTTTQELFKYCVGDLVGIIGPNGNNFSLKGNRILLVAGGIGIAPIRFLARYLKLEKKDYVVSILGFKSKSDVILKNEFEKYCDNVYITTEDGTIGTKGFATDLVENIITKCDIDYIYSCGPELMMKKLSDLCLKIGIPSEFSLERYMHCGIGICGFCSMDGLIVCRDGPVFSSDKLKDVSEFGKFRINPTGKKEKI